MANNDAELRIGVNDDDLRAGLQRAADAVQTGFAQMQTHFDSLGAVFGKLNGAMMAFAAAMAGGKIFADGVEETVKLTKEANALSKTLGITATEASILNVALGDIYQSGDAVVTATSRITKQLRENEDAFAKLGVATRDSEGHFRGSLDIMLDVNQELLKFKEGTDRNIEGQKIYGKSWAEISGLLKLNTELMEESRKKAQALGLVVGEENVQATAKYRAAMNDMHDVFSGIQKVIGDAVLPLLTDLGNWLASVGPQAVEFMRKAMATLVSAFYGLKMAVEIVWETVKAAVQQITVLLLTIADVGSRALQFDFAGAKKAWSDGLAQMREIGDQWANQIVKDAEGNRDKIFSAWSSALNGAVTPTKAKGAGAHSEGGEDTGKSRMSAWEMQLREQKVAYQEQMREQGSFQEYSKQQELAFWQTKLELVRKGTEEERQLRARVADIKLAIDKSVFDGEMEKLKATEAEYGKNYEARIAIAKDYAERMKSAYGEESKQYAEAVKRVHELDLQLYEQRKQLQQMARESAMKNTLSEIDAEQDLARQRLELRQTTTEEFLQQEREFENRRHQIQMAALQDSLKLAKQDAWRDPEGVAKAQHQIEELERQHQNRIRDIRHKQILEDNKATTSFLNSMESGFTKVFSSMMKGSMSVSQAIKSMFATMGDAIIKILAEIAAKWLTTQLANMLLSKTAAQGEISAASALAGANGTASWAAAPWPVNMGAPAFGASMAAAAASFNVAASAEGGFDIPSGVNPVTQLHQEEMVLPADIANPLRQGLAAGGVGGNSFSPTIQVNAMNSRDVERALREGGALNRVLKDMHRSFQR